MTTISPINSNLIRNAKRGAKVAPRPSAIESNESWGSECDLARDPGFRRDLVDTSRLDARRGVPLNPKFGFIRPTIGAVSGVGTAVLMTTTGVDTSLHEVVGHGYLGGHLLHDYAPGREPRFQVDGWDNAEAIGDAENFSEAMKALGRLLGAHDVGDDGALGKAWVRGGEPNALGEAMGADGMSAWISLSGSLPGLALNSLAVIGGMKLKDSHPAAGYALLACGLTQHLMSSGYPITAALMDNATLAHEASVGHDFANFARCVGRLTGLSAQTVAIATAAVWTGLVPAVALGMYLHQKSHKGDIVPDHLALQHWLSQSQDDPKRDKVFIKLFNQYPGKENLQMYSRNLVQLQCLKMEHPEDEEISAKLSHTWDKLHDEKTRFDQFLLGKIPKSALKKSKLDVVEKWEKLQANNKVQMALTTLSVGGMAVGVMGRIFGVLGRTVAKGLAPIATALSYVFPALQALAIGASAYETYKDLKSPTSKVPMPAKVVSVVKTAGFVIGSAAMAAATFVPGLNMIFIPAMIFTIISCIGLSFAKNRILKKSFELHQSVIPDQWNFMYHSLRVYKQDYGDVKVSRNDGQHAALRSWISMQKEASKRGILSPEQRGKLERIGMLKEAPEIFPPVLPQLSAMQRA